MKLKRQSAFEGNRKLLKGGLHCHTTRSDGEGTPEETIARHIELGYDFLSITDHGFYNMRNYGDHSLTIIPGMEAATNFRERYMNGVHSHHIVTIGPMDESRNGLHHDQIFETIPIDYAAQTQPFLDEMHAKGNLTIYAHPEWSGTTIDELRVLHGNFAMEIWSTGSAFGEGLDTNCLHWDQLLAEGHRLYGVASDDGHAMRHHGFGWVMVNSENDVDSILDALKNGRFYASTGPEIYDFYVENGYVHVKSSPVVEINVRNFWSPYPLIRPKEGEETLTEASFLLERGAGVPYIRAIVKDAQGRRAWSNPIWLDDEDFLPL